MRKLIIIVFILLITNIGNAQIYSTQPNCIRVQEIDGTPNVACVRTIKVTNGALTNNGGGVVTITIGSLTPTFLLLEDSSYILLEDGVKINLE
jgi:hypothetical protein